MTTPSPVDLTALPGLPSTHDEPVFHAPWEARAFALVNQLATAEHYTWAEWTDYLISEIAVTEQTAPGTKNYYEQWVCACEKLLADKGLLTSELIQQKIADLLSEREAEHKH